MLALSYCTIDDVINEFHPTLKVQIEKHYGDKLNENLEKHIAKAEDFVNASLARAYSVPLKKAASSVISAECKIAAYFAGIAYSEKDEILKDKYEIAREMLDNLVEADNASLVDEGLTDDDIAPDVAYGSDEKIFTSELLEKW